MEDQDRCSGCGVGRPLLVAVGLFLTGGAPAAAPTAADAVVECMRANIPQTVRVQTFEMTAHDRSGAERVLRGRMYGSREKDRIQVMARIEFPRDLAGAAFLVREAAPHDEIYLYLPSVNRVKRVSGAAADGKVWGTDFSYNDFKQVQNAFAAGSASLVGAAEVDGRPVHIVAFTPGDAGQSLYDQVRAQVDRQTCVLLKAEFIHAGVAKKRLTVPPGALKQAGKRWYVSRALLEDLQEGTRTSLSVIGVTEGVRLSASYFHPNQFYSAH